MAENGKGKGRGKKMEDENGKGTRPSGIIGNLLPSTRGIDVPVLGWLRSTVVERRSLALELSLSCARPVADG